MYFIGVTTTQSSINRIFPRWAAYLGLGVCELRGWDFPLNAPAEDYRAAVDFIKRDPLTLGALVTTHKVALFRACHDQFDVIEPLARELGEISSVFKRSGRLQGRAVDPETVGYALDVFLPASHWQSGAAALILGAGGAGTALAWRLAHAPGASRPTALHVVDRDAGRLEHLKTLHANWRNAAPLKLHLADHPGVADRLVSVLPAGSLVVNATGAGKDTPGSPLTDAAVFPTPALVWDFNYRGELAFLRQARAQERERELRIVDGWDYFVHGWTRVIADVFDREIPTHGPCFDELSRIAAQTR